MGLLEGGGQGALEGNLDLNLLLWKSQLAVLAALGCETFFEGEA